MAVESGWLIEKKDEETGNTVYTGVVDITTGIEKGSYIEWVPDAHNALRFARREDAQRHKDVFSGDDAIVAEHLFETPVSAGMSPEERDIRHALNMLYLDADEAAVDDVYEKFEAYAKYRVKEQNNG